MWYNAIMKWVLSSPLHGMLSRSMVLITYTGRKSGRTYTVPTNYARDGSTLWITSYRRRTWWRNFQGGAPVVVRLQGQDRQGTAEAITDPAGVSEGLKAYLKDQPQNAKYFAIGLDDQGRPKAADLAQAAQERVVVRIQL